MVFKSAKCACKREIVLNSKEFTDTVLQPFTKNIEIPINGSLTTKDLFNTIIGMTVKNPSVHSASSSYQNTPCETSVRYHLKKLNLEELTAINEKILTNSISNFLKPGRRYRFAIDFTNDPYYGSIDDSNRDHIIRSKGKSQQTRFIPILPVSTKVRKEEYLDYFITLIKRMGLNIEVLCLDRGEVFDFL